ncbi:hypothetical protein LINGRAHAP2_LOCUS9938 [Linum grandiflorum]
MSLDTFWTLVPHRCYRAGLHGWCGLSKLQVVSR